MPLQLTIACGDYDRTHPLIDGSIKAGRTRAQLARAATSRNLDAHVELLRLRRLGDFFVVIPDCADDRKTSDGNSGFPGASIPSLLCLHQHEKRHSRAEGSYGEASRLGEFQQTATVWVRGTLQHEYGVKLDDIEWYTWTPHSRMEMELPKRYRVTHIPSDRKPDQMLFDGELDATMICASLFPSLLNPPSHVRRLFENS